MEFTKELLEKAKKAETAEELAETAKAAGIELSENEAEKYFTEISKTGELSDNELDNVAGGCGDPEPATQWGSPGVWEYEKDVIYDFDIGTRVYVYITPARGSKGTVLSRKIDKDDYGYHPAYLVKHDDRGAADDWYGQANVGKLL